MFLSLSLPVVSVGYAITLLSTAIVTVGTAAFVNAAKWYGQCVCHCHCQWLVWAMILSLSSLPVVSVGYVFVTITASG